VAGGAGADHRHFKDASRSGKTRADVGRLT
jgi:hypothetical protein